MDNQREFYRVRYRKQHCPVMKVAEQSLPLLDLSEGGARIPRSELFVEGAEPIAVEIVFPDNQLVKTFASYLRQVDDQLAVRFSPFIPMTIIFSEQRRMLRLYPAGT